MFDQSNLPREDPGMISSHVLYLLTHCREVKVSFTWFHGCQNSTIFISHGNGDGNSYLTICLPLSESKQGPCHECSGHELKIDVYPFTWHVLYTSTIIQSNSHKYRIDHMIHIEKIQQNLKLLICCTILDKSHQSSGPQILHLRGFWSYHLPK